MAQYEVKQKLLHCLLSNHTSMTWCLKDICIRSDFRQLSLALALTVSNLTILSHDAKRTFLLPPFVQNQQIEVQSSSEQFIIGNSPIIRCMIVSDQMVTRMTKGWRRFKSPKCSDLCENHGGTQLPEPNISRISLHLKGFSHGFSQTTDPNRFSQAIVFSKSSLFREAATSPFPDHLIGRICLVFNRSSQFWIFLCSLQFAKVWARLRLSSDLKKDFDFTPPRKLN